MTQLRHRNPPRDLSSIVPFASSKKKKLSKKEKKARAQRILDIKDTRPVLSRAEKATKKEQDDALYVANNPSRLIKAKPRKR